eukprot:8458389-Prorocentrum_lima.AAC.1
MTSSLVGSEMCIRDRPRVVRNIATSALDADWEYGLCLGHRVVDINNAVSYTHLTLPTICSV